MKKPIFYWDEEEGSALCVIQDKEKSYYGVATCHPDDRDMMSEKTGCELAYMRAFLKSLYGKKNDFRLELKALKKYYYTINTSKHFNPKSYEAQRLLSQIGLLEADIKTLKELIKEQRQNIFNFIQNKAWFYQKIRHNRKVDKRLAENK